MKRHLLSKTLLALALVLISGSVWGEVLFHETFGDNTGSARVWDDSYSVKSGVSTVYSGITSYTVTNAKQGKNTTGYSASGLNQSTQGTDAVIIIGPLNVASYNSLNLTYQWKAASIKGTYTTKAYYATSSGGTYTEVTGTGTGATSFVERSYSLPAAAQVSTLYLKIVWNTSNTQAIIDEVELTGNNSSKTSTTLTFNVSSLDKYSTDDNFTQTATLKAGETVLNKTITYSSSDTEVATVTNNGEVDILKAGTTTITASFAGDNDYNSSTTSYTLNVTGHYTTLDDAIAAQGTSTIDTDILMTFNNVEVTNVDGNNVTIKEGNTEALIYQSGHGFDEGDVLYGTVSCTTDYYQSTFEFKGVTSTTSGLSVLAVSPSTANDFTYTEGEGPSEQNFSIGKLTIQANTTASACINGDTNSAFEISEDGITYGTSDLDNLAKDDVVYVRLKAGLAIGNYTATLVIGNGQVFRSIALTGRVLEPFSSISLSGTPDKTTYIIGENFDPTGLAVQTNIGNDVTSDPGIGWTITPTTFTTSGAQKVKVKATYQSVESNELEIDVTVNKKPVTITLNPVTVTLHTNENIVASTTPSGLALTYSVDNDDVASVSGTAITGVGSGTAILTASFAGNDEYAATSATAEVTVVLPNFTWNLTTNSYDTNPSENKVTWDDTYATMTNEKNSSTTPANNYLGGDANNRTSTRFYSGQTLTITPKGSDIQKVEFTATSTNYASALGGSTWTNATATASEKTVTVTPTDGTTDFSATIGATCGFSEVKVFYLQTQAVTISEVGWATACLPFDAEVPAGVTAYIITAATETSLDKTEVTSVPFKTGLLLKGAAGTYTFTESEFALDDVSANLLKGSTSGELFNDATNYTYYILANGTNENGDGGLGFYWQYDNGTQADCAQYKAVLALPKNTNPNPAIGFRLDGATMVDVLNAEAEQAVIYDLTGRRVENATRGIYIVNGKKVMVK